MADEIVIINDNSEYKKRQFDLYGYHVDINNRRFRKYFPKIALESKLENKILEIEMTQKYILDSLFVLLQPRFPTTIPERLVDWDLPTRSSPGKWHRFKIRELSEIPLRTCTGLLMQSFKAASSLFMVEYSKEGKAYYNTQLTDTVIGFKPRKARLTNRVNTYHLANLLIFQLKCIDNVFDTEWFELKPESKNLYSYLNNLIPMAKEFSLENEFEPIKFRFFIEDNYPQLYIEYQNLSESASTLQKDPSWGIRAIATLFSDIFWSNLNEWSPMLCCRTDAALRFMKRLKGEGYLVPSNEVMLRDPIEKLRGDRIWFAGMKEELEWQANKFAELLDLTAAYEGGR